MSDIVENPNIGLSAQAASDKGRNWSSAHVQLTCRRECVGDVRLETQEQVDEFGALRCTEIIGSLIVTGTVASLEPLAALHTITGDLFVQENDSLSTLHGLECLRDVGGQVTLIDASALTTVAALGNLQKIGGALEFIRTAVQRIGPFCHLKTLGNLFVGDNAALERIDGFNSCHLREIEFATIRNNDSLQRVVGFNGLRTIEVTFALLQNNMLQSVRVLQRLTVGTVFVLDLPALTEFCDLTKVQTNRPATGLVFSQLPLLRHLPAFPRLHTINGTLQLDELPSVTNMDGLSAVKSVTGSVRILLTQFENLDGLAQLESVGRILAVLSNAALMSTAGLLSLTEVGDFVIISDNISLSDFCGLQPLASQDPTGDPPFLVQNNAANPDKQAIAALQPCDVCNFVRLLLQRWVNDNVISTVTQRYFLFGGLGEQSVQCARRFNAITANQALILRAALEWYARQQETKCTKDLLLCCAPEGAPPCCASDIGLLRHELITQCTAFRQH